MPDATMKPCKKSNQCLDLSTKGKISCASCRYKKCLAVGMHKEGEISIESSTSCMFFDNSKPSIKSSIFSHFRV